MRRMGTVPDDRAASPATPPPQQRGWFSRVPLWVRIVVPVLLVLVLVGGATAVFVVSSQPREPVDAARSACLSGVRAELESRDQDVVEMPLFRDVADVGDGTYRTQGQVAFTEADGSERSVAVRCIARLEDGTMRVASIRFSP